MTTPAQRRARSAKVLTAAQLEQVALRFRILGEPARLQLLQALMPGEQSVGELSDTLGLSPANTSKHLQMLLANGVVGRRKDGLFAHYRITDESVLELCNIVCGRLARDSRTRERVFAGR